MSAKAKAKAAAAAVVTALLFLLISAASASGDAGEGENAKSACSLGDNATLLECAVVFKKGRNVVEPDFLSRLPSSGIKTLRLRCRIDGADGDGVFLYLRDVLDAGLETASAASADALTFPDNGIERLEVIDCPVKRLQRLDLLFVASSVTSGLVSLTVRNERSDLVVERQARPVLTVEADAFQDAPRGLAALDLSGNGISSADPQLLCPLGRTLARLNVSHNALGSLDIVTSCPLERLRHLHAFHNRLRRVPGRGALGRSLPNLSELDLSSSGLASLESGALSGLGELHVVKLSHNGLKSVPADLVGPDNAVRELYLGNNSLSEIPAALLERLGGQLLVLNLSNNVISSNSRWLRDAPFSALKNLVALDLSHNRLANLGAGLFRGLGALQVLTAAHNQIRSLAKDAFAHTPSLHALVLSHNSLEDLREAGSKLDATQRSVFDGLEKISSLGLDHNRLKVLDRHLFQNCCSILKDLSLHSNLFRHIPHPALRHLGATLRTLDLGENQISEVHPSALAGLDALDGLRLAGNGIRRLGEAVFEKSTAIKRLNLADNDIEHIDQKTFTPLKRLKALRLDNNRLEELNGLLNTQHHLQWLNVSHNLLQWFDYAFIPKSLLWLNLRNNQIEELGNYYDMQAGFRLVHLDVGGNRLQRIDRECLVHSLKEIQADFNVISELAANTFSGLSNLTTVNLTHNRLEKFAINSLTLRIEAGGGRGGGQKASEKGLVDFFLGGNPLSCDCEMEWLKRINQLSAKAPSEFPRIADWHDLTCSLHNRLDPGSTPATSRGGNESAPGGHLVLPLPRVQLSEFLCPYSTHCFALCMCCDFFACDCRMKCSEGCDCYHDSTWSANIIQCGGREHDKVPKFIPMDATHVYLDGNALADLSSDTFVGRKHLASLYLNSSRIETVSDKTFNGLTELVSLHLEDNAIAQLRGAEFADLSSLRELYLHRNLLSFIHGDTFKTLASLEALTLSENKLASYPAWELRANAALQRLDLDENPLSCRCEFLQPLRKFILANRAIVSDVGSLSCVKVDGEVVSHFANASLCAADDNDVMAVSLSAHSDDSGGDIVVGLESDGDVGKDGTGVGGGEGILANLIPAVAVVCAAFIIVISLIILAVAFRKPVSLWFHSKYGLRLLRAPPLSVPPPTLNGGRGGPVHSMTSKAAAAGTPVAKPIDAYVHYSPTDSAFAHQTLGDGLRQHYNIHFHHSDAGVDASAALEASSRVILVASNDYMLNDVAQDELKTILGRMRGGGVGLERGVIVVVLTDSEKKHLKRHFGSDSALLRWNDASFWKKLRFHLPEPSGNGAGDPMRHRGQTMEAAFGAALAPRPRGQSDYEDDMWTYMKGAVSGSQQSHSSGGQDSSLSTRSTTDNSGTMPPPLQFPVSTTLSMAVMGSERTAGTTNSRRRPPAAATHSLRPSKTSVSPPGARLIGGTQQRRSASRRHIVENPLEDACDAEYMSVVGARDGSLTRRHGVNPPLPEPIYHTLEPPSSPNEDEDGSGFERQNKRARRKKKGQGDSAAAAVYINNELELVYPQRGDLLRPSTGGPVVMSANGPRSRNGGPNASLSSSSAATAAGQQRHLIQMLQNAADFEEDEYADQEDEELLQSELDFDTSGGQNSVDLGGISPCGRSHLGGGGGGSYVPSPAPGSMPRRPSAVGSGKLVAQQAVMSSPRGRYGAPTAGAGPMRIADVSARSPSSRALAAAAAKQAGYYI